MVAGCIDFGGERAQRRHRGQRAGFGLGAFEGGQQRGECFVGSEELNGARGQPLVDLGDPLLQRSERGQVDLAHVAQFDEVADGGPRGSESLEVRGRVAQLQLRVGHQVGHEALCVAQPIGGFPLRRHHRGELVEHVAGRLAQLDEQAVDATGFGLGQPAVAVQQHRAARDHCLEHGLVELRIERVTGQRECLTQHAHELGVTDTTVEARSIDGRRVLLGGAERAGIHAHRVHTLRLRGVANGDDEAVVEQRVTVGGDGRGHRARHHVVRAEQVLPRHRLVVGVEDVLTVGTLVRGVEPEQPGVAGAVLGGHREHLVLAVLQVVATGEHNALPLGQLVAVPPHGVGAVHGASEPVVDVEALGSLAVRVQTDDQQVAQWRVPDAQLVDGLRLRERLRVHGTAAVDGIVDAELHPLLLDADVQDVLDDVVPPAPFDDQLPAGLAPLEVERRHARAVVVAVCIDVRGLGAIGAELPAQHAHVVVARADREHHQQAPFGDLQLLQLCVGVIGEQLTHVAGEPGVGQEPRGVVTGHFGEAPVATGRCLHAIERERVAHSTYSAQGATDVEAEQQQVAHAHHVARLRRLLGTQTILLDQREWHRREQLGARGVHLVRRSLQPPRDRLLAVAEQLVGARRHHRACGGRCRSVRCRGGRIGHEWLTW